MTPTALEVGGERASARGDGRSPAQPWALRNLPLLVLGAAVGGSIVLLLTLSWGLTFYQDTWAFLMHRRAFTVDAFLMPHNEHIALIPVAIEKLLVTAFGMTSAMPEYVVLILMLALTDVLLFVYVRRRLGPWPAVMAAAILLFLGPAWPVLLWPFEIGFVGSILAGIGMLLQLEREDRRGDRAACLLLAFSVGFSSLGLPFLAAAAVDVLQKRRTRGLRRAYVAAIPLFLFLVWYAGWGHTAESHLSLRNVLASPPYLLNGLASSLDTVLGLSTVPIQGVGQPEWGRPLLLAAAVLVALWKARRPWFSPRLWPAVAATAGFWLLAAFNYIPGREPTSNRYAYAGAAFILLVAANLLQGIRLGRKALLAAGVVTLAAIASNLIPLKQGRDFLAEQTTLTRADVGAIDIARRTVSPSFSLTPEVAGTPSLIDVNAAQYLPAVREYGSPGYTPAKLETAAEAGRRQADIVLAQALPISASTRVGAYDTRVPTGESCLALPGGAATASSDVTLSPGLTRIELAPGPSAALALRRFALGNYPVAIAKAPGGSTTALEIPADLARQPWHLHVEASQRSRVCRSR